jgi:hypothetical protein
MDTNVTPVAFPGDPGHEAGSQPARGLKGGCASVHTQAPSLQEANTGSATGSPLDTSGDITGWDTSVLSNTGGSHGIGGNDNRSKAT